MECLFSSIQTRFQPPYKLVRPHSVSNREILHISAFTNCIPFEIKRRSIQPIGVAVNNVEWHSAPVASVMTQFFVIDVAWRTNRWFRNEYSEIDAIRNPIHYPKGLQRRFHHPKWHSPANWLTDWLTGGQLHSPSLDDYRVNSATQGFPSRRHFDWAIHKRQIHQSSLKYINKRIWMGMSP